MKTLRFILGDQLSESISSLNDCNKKKDIIFMCEVWNEATYVRHHQKKLVFIFSAMRHFKEQLINAGYQVDYIELNPKNHLGSFSSELKKAIKRHQIEKVVITEASEYRVQEEINTWQKKLNVDVSVLKDNRFLCDKDAFKEWAKDKKSLRMEFFYRELRKKYDILMQNGQPEGGQWNYDSQNRKAIKKQLDIPKPFYSKMDRITKEVKDLISKYFKNNFGSIEPFHYAVTREEALKTLQHFIKERLQYFGDYQDAMLQDEPWLFHSHISLYLNCGLLNPMECIKEALKAFKNHSAPLNAVEGFIRQILGWREYVRGIYWLKMPQYSHANALNAKRALPEFYWTADTNMNCLKQCIKETQENAYAHHIQRLMVLGNFALLAGIKPKEVNEWYLLVYADAYEWVEMPNVTGMTLFADHGLLASKPYAASGSYINKMSNYCSQCHYQVNQKTGAKACPFNYLYWNFLIENEKVLKDNQRLKMVYSTLKKMSQEKKEAILESAKQFFKKLKQS